MKNIQISNLLASDAFGLLILSYLALNRASFAWVKHYRGDVIYGPDLSQHWLEALLPMDAWIFIWVAIGLLSILSIWSRRLKSLILIPVTISLFLWGVSSAFSPQQSSVITGALWIAVSLMLIWGSSRVSSGAVDRAKFDQGYQEHLENLRGDNDAI